MSIDLSTLNDSQRDAVNWQEGPLLVLAGPGSGKTRVLTLRIARLIQSTPDSRFRVLGVTFTNKAATEMRTRIDGLLVDGRDRALLTTFHSFAADILRQHGSHVGLKPDFAILSDQADREAALTDAIKSVISPDADFTPNAAQLLPGISRMLDECILPSDAATRLGNLPNAREIAGVYTAYRTRLIATNQLDFGSLLAIAVELLEKLPAVSKQVRRVYSFVCVDEFQDTNTAQYRLLAQLVPTEKPNLFVVADDDQVIYQWNGANPARLEELRQRFQMQLLQLPENFRCPPEVIVLANNLIKHNSDRATDKKPLSAHKIAATQGKVTATHFHDFGDEMKWIAERLSAMPVAERQKSVILARRKKLLEEMVKALELASIPAYVAVRKNEFQSAPYRWLHSLLRLANARQDREHLRRLGLSYYQLEGIKVPVEDVVARAGMDSSDFLTAWLHVASASTGLTPESAKNLAVVREKLVERMDYWSVIKAAHHWFAAVRALPGTASETAFDEFDDEKIIWEALINDISTHYSLSDLTLHNFLQEMDLRAKEKPAPPEAVRCYTIHASKGMEFRNVFLIGLVEDELPSWAAVKKSGDSPEMREERRNCFVAITRAEETLNLTYSDRYFGYAKSPSRFLKEMGFKV
jgi:DNA helicase II / ATP-dependent DNA helicase PcrA